MIDIDKIRKIESLRDCISRAKRELDEAAKPASLSVHTLFNCYRNMFGPDWRKVDNTKVFLFVYMYNFAPSSLLGVKLPDRRQIAQMLGLKCQNAVSIRSRHLLFCYRTFPKFRRSADALQDSFINASDNEEK